MMKDLNDEQLRLVVGGSKHRSGSSSKSTWPDLSALDGIVAGGGSNVATNVAVTNNGSGNTVVGIASATSIDDHSITIIHNHPPTK